MEPPQIFRTPSTVVRLSRFSSDGKSISTLYPVLTGFVVVNRISYVVCAPTQLLSGLTRSISIELGVSTYTLMVWVVSSMKPSPLSPVLIQNPVISFGTGGFRTFSMVKLNAWLVAWVKSELIVSFYPDLFELVNKELSQVQGTADVLTSPVTPLHMIESAG